MNELLKTLNEYLQAAAKVIVQQAPEVWQHTLLLIRVEAAYTLAVILIVYALLAWSLKFSKSHLVKNVEDKYCRGSGCCEKIQLTQWDMDSWFGFQFCATTVASIAWTAYTLLTMLHILLGLFSPELWILYQLAAKVGII